MLGASHLRPTLRYSPEPSDSDPRLLWLKVSFVHLGPSIRSYAYRIHSGQIFFHHAGQDIKEYRRIWTELEELDSIGAYAAAKSSGLV